MAKPEAWRLDAANYPMTLTANTRFQDMDVYGHLNNVAYAALFESARARLNNDIRAASDHPANERMLIANVSINYLHEGHFPDDVEIAQGIGPIGRSSWTIVQAMFQNGRCIATADTVLVCRTDGEAKPLRPEKVAELKAKQAQLP